MVFDADVPNTAEAKKTGYSLDGKEITLTRKRGRPRKIRNPLFIPQDKKVEACALYCVWGDVKKVAELLEIPEAQVRLWKEEPWWAEIQKKIMVEQNDGLLSKINTTIEQALAMLEDRVLNGDVVFVPARIGKDGNLICEESERRLPIKARDLAQIFHALTHQRNLMRGDPTQITSQDTTAKRLEDLRNHFKEFTQSRLIEGESTVISIGDEQK